VRTFQLMKTSLLYYLLLALLNSVLTILTWTYRDNFKELKRNED